MSDRSLRGLDERIAKLRGWRKLNHNGGWFRRGQPKRFVQRHYADSPPPYSTDLNLAWELVEEMREALNSIHPTDEGWTVRFYIGWSNRSALAPTPAEAIARAWLAWKEGQADGQG